MVETNASAQGNAQALIYYLEGLHPAETEFPTRLTADEEELHFYFNDHILEVAEQAEELVNQLDAMIERRIPHLQNMRSIYQEEGNTALVAHTDDMLEQMQRDIPRLEAQLETRMTEVENIMNGVRADYRRLAEVLAAGREEYRTYMSTVYVEDQENAEAIRRIEEDGATLEDIGYNPYASGFEHLGVRHEAREYERVFGDYQLLRNGVAIRMSSTELSNLVWAGVGMVLADIITGGILKVVVIGGRMIRIAAGASTRLANAGARIARRYNALTEKGKDFLDRARARTRGDDAPAYDRRGQQVQGDERPRPATGTCAVGARVACGT